MQRAGLISRGLVDRGDPAVADKLTADFTLDAAWHDLDLSAIVPAGAKWIFFEIEMDPGAGTEQFSLRKNGNANERNVTSLYRIAGSGMYTTDGLCPCDDNRIVEYNATAGGITFLLLTVKGWSKC